MEKPKKIMYLMIFFYTVGWSIISLLRYYSFNARYFDLGVSMGYITYSVEGLTLSKFVQIFALKPIVYLLVPIAYAFSFQGLLVFQSFFLALGAYPVFMISLEKLKNGTLAAQLSASYLLYFPLAGLNWFDFHYQALFPTLFLLGYWFYIKGKQSLSLTFMALSGMVHYPYTVFPLLFALMLALGKDRKKDFKIWFPLLIITVTIFLINVYLYGIYGASFGTVYAPLSKPSYFAVYITIVLILLPLAFVPIFSKWIFFMTPFLALIFLVKYWGYVYPNIFKLQYGALFIPFVFLGVIEGVEWLEKRSVMDKKRAVGLVFVSVVMFAAIYQPYSPLNKYTSVNYNINQIFNVNLTEYNQLMKILSLIPRGSTVLVSGNDPEAFYPYYGLIPYDNSITNPELVYNGTIKYIVAGPYGLQYTAVPPKPMVPMDQLVENASKKGFGIYAEAYGMMLLKYNYTGPLKYYYPLKEYFPSSSFVPTAPWFMKDGMIVATNAHMQLWFGPELILPPGKYIMTVFLKSTSNSSSNWLSVAVYADDQTQLITVYYINGASLKPGWNAVNISFTVPRVYANAEVIGYAYKWQGTLYVKGIYINQTSYTV